MRTTLKLLAWSFLFVALLPGAAAAQRVHRIEIEANAEKDTYRFRPRQVSVRPGDVLVFRAGSGSPHSIVFEGDNLSSTAREALNGALPRRSADLSSPLLTASGSEYRIVVPALPAGSYPFFCLPHRAYDERGTLVIAR